MAHRDLALIVDRLLAQLRRRRRDLARDHRGTTLVLFTLLLVPVILLGGACIDYASARQAKSELDAAADSAVLAVVARGTLGTDPATAQQAMISDFNGVAASHPVGIVTAQGTVTDSGGSRTASIQYTASVPTKFMTLAGINTMTITGSSQSVAAAPIYTDFYVLLDNTPSMGIGATQTDIATMVNHTPDQCAFACHDVSANGNDYYALARKLGVTMRIDVVRQATQQLMDRATASALVPGQFRAALYTMGTSCSQTGLTAISPLSADLAGAKSNAGAIDLMTIPYQGYNNDQCSDFDGVLSALGGQIPMPGSGATAGTPQKVVFLVSDGVADAYYPGSCTKPTTGGRCQEPLTVAACNAMKARGISIAVLYTTYLPLPTNGWYTQWIAPFQSGIGTQMQACASPGLYFEVSPTQGIADAMLALFDRVIRQTHLTL